MTTGVSVGPDGRIDPTIGVSVGRQGDVGVQGSASYGLGTGRAYLDAGVRAYGATVTGKATIGGGGLSWEGVSASWNPFETYAAIDQMMSERERARAQAQAAAAPVVRPAIAAAASIAPTTRAGAATTQAAAVASTQPTSQPTSAAAAAADTGPSLTLGFVPSGDLGYDPMPLVGPTSAGTGGQAFIPWRPRDESFDGVAALDTAAMVGNANDPFPLGASLAGGSGYDPSGVLSGGDPYAQYLNAEFDKQLAADQATRQIEERWRGSYAGDKTPWHLLAATPGAAKQAFTNGIATVGDYANAVVIVGTDGEHRLWDGTIPGSFFDNAGSTTSYWKTIPAQLRAYGDVATVASVATPFMRGVRVPVGVGIAPAAAAQAEEFIGPTIGRSGYRTMEEFDAAVGSKYQQLVDQGHAYTMHGVQQGFIVNHPTVIGREIDDFARIGLRDWLQSVEGINEGPGGIIQVNRRLWDPAGTGKFRVPDVYIRGARSVYDATIAEKTASLPQAADFHAFSGGGNVTIVRPSTLVTPAARGSYGIYFP